LVFISFCVSGLLVSQTLQDFLTNFEVNEDEAMLTDDEIMILENYTRQPINLNSASEKMLDNVPLLSQSDISLILAARKVTSIFNSIDDVLQIPDISNLGRQLIPLISTIKIIGEKSVWFRSRWANSGEDERLLLQSEFTLRSITAGFIIERDPLEPTLTDYVSGYLLLKIGNNVKFSLGNHQVHTGYGLLFGRTTKQVKLMENFSQLQKVGKGIKPNRSTTEYWSLRGVGVDYTTSAGRFFISITSNPRDASIDDGVLRSISNTGLHQTETELNRKHNIYENIALVGWYHEKSDFLFGTIYSSQTWRMITETPLGLNSSSYLSCYGKWNKNNFNLFGEVASSTGNKLAYISGFSVTGESLKWLSSFRFYPDGFTSPRTQPFREWGSSELNEMGIYQVIIINAGKYKLITYGDMYRQVSGVESFAPVNGFETGNQLTARWRKINFSIRWKLEEKSVESSITYNDPFVFNGIFITSKESWRLSLTRQVLPMIKIQSQFDWVNATDQNNFSIGKSLSLKAHLKKKNAKLSLHWIGYDTEDYTSRVYVWDMNLPGELRSRAFYLQGQSLAMFLRYSFQRNSHLSFRMRQNWQYDDETHSWSIPKSDGGFQMDIAF
tara:strand:+ start:50667 stop:52502 length:1836 start_codon:yes stop_codon:yes gene_type:complete